VQREQLKWLMTGAGVTVLALVGVFTFAQGSGPLYAALDAACLLLAFALPISITVGVLRYRLYEIDRLVSRALGYTLTTALVIGLFVGLVSLVDGVVGSTSSLAVAACTLAAAGLFNPLRHYLQRRVDRRFNRARYDADTLVANFASGLRDTVDTRMVQRRFLETVDNAVEPASAWLWVPNGGQP
jgi:O-antigen/teichoic acid export membrane protein